MEAELLTDGVTEVGFGQGRRVRKIYGVRDTSKSHEQRDCDEGGSRHIKKKH